MVMLATVQQEQKRFAAHATKPFAHVIKYVKASAMRARFEIFHIEQSLQKNKKLFF